MTEFSDEQGMRARREVLGDEHVDRSFATATDFTEEFHHWITQHAWGAAWARPGLDRRMRSALTIALLTALNFEHELAMHVHAGLRNGLTREEIKEILLHTAVYAGVPAANRGFVVAQSAFDELDAKS